MSQNCSWHKLRVIYVPKCRNFQVNIKVVECLWLQIEIMTQLVLKLSEKGEETTIIIPEVELTDSFRTSITSALASLVNSASAKIVEDAMLNAPLPAFPCMADEEMLCSCEVQLPHLLAVPPESSGKPCGQSRGGPKTLSQKVRFSVRLGDHTASYIPMSFC